MAHLSSSPNTPTLDTPSWLTPLTEAGMDPRLGVPAILIGLTCVAILVVCCTLDALGRRIHARRRNRGRPATAAEGRAAADAEMARHFGTPHRAVPAAPARREVGSAA